MGIEYKYKKHPVNDTILVVESTEVKEVNLSLKVLNGEKEKLEYDKQVAIDAYDGRISKVQNKIDQAIALGVKESISVEP